MSRVRLTLEQAQEAYSERFNAKGYSLVSYESSQKPVTISCPIHGLVQAPTYISMINSKYPCPTCGKEAKSISAAKVSGKLTDDEYLKLFHEVHGDKYTYDMTRDEKYRITLHCPIHGDSRILPSHIANQKRGCPKCGRASIPGRPKKST